MQTIFLLLAIAAQIAAPDEPLVVEEVDAIAICHVADGAELVFFFCTVQGEWTCLDHRWLAADMAPRFDGRRFSLAWHDDGDSCYRVIRSAAWIESWERENPLAEIRNRPWFARLLVPGLAQAPRRPQ